MKSIAEEIKQGKIFVSDGAWGTFLQQKGLKPGECPESWNLTHPDAVYDIARSYIEAGSDMIETNSFGGNAFKLSFFGLEREVYALNKAAAELSRKAAGPNRYVLGSIGPTGKILMMGDVCYDELYQAFKDQAMALEAGGADALVVETMSDIEEAKAAVSACRENTACEVICTMTFEKSNERSYHSMMGITPTEMVGEMIAAGASIIGANCGNGMENMIGITEEIRSVNRTIPILIHANAGAPVYQNGETHFLETPEITAGYVKLLLDAGANIIGGCCGTTPEHIARIAAVVREYKRV
ncbi:MAG TPA: homocysteine S-methyltransferase family protein [Prolixibacteraceae bacterium]|nr:homocysteine S-methyltransferase family protein [Prolixibacteraceae bacterium]